MLETNLKFKNVAIGNSKLYQLTQDDIENIQKLLLDVMEDVKYVCKKYNLTYTLCGGSALGAVRHKGYIPWDEDLDICMPRRDYDKFEEKFLCEFSDKYWVQNIKTSPKYDLSFMKIRVKGTRYMEIFDPEEEKAGMFIDIFPVENTYDSSIQRRIHGTISEALLFICSCVRIRSKKSKILEYLGDDGLGKVVRIKNAIGFVFSFLSIHQWLMITEKFLSKNKNENSKYVMIPSGRGHYFGEIYTRDSFFPEKEVQFEDRTMMLQKNVDEYLTTLYGDYMKIPPEDKRERHSVIEYSLKEK